MKMVPWIVFGAESRPGRLQDANRKLGDSTFGAFLAENGVPRADSGPQENPKSPQNLTFADRLAFWSSKNCLWKGVRKKHEKLMKNRCEN
jgi:hypothetical protein